VEEPAVVPRRRLRTGVQITTGVANGLADKIEQAIGTALPGVILILIASVAPAALFKLLAFVTPTPAPALHCVSA
jgi:hypothetical protein